MKWSLVYFGVFFLGMWCGYYHAYHSHEGHRDNGEWYWPKGVIELEIIDVRVIDVKRDR